MVYKVASEETIGQSTTVDQLKWGFMMRNFNVLAFAAIPLCALSAPVLAQDEAEGPAPAWELDAELAAFSDYRFRGISMSGKEPELTADLSVSHESGFYAGTWLSNVDLGSGADDLEVDLYAGFSTDVGGLTFDVGGIYYVYPGNSGLDYVELTSSVAVAAGPGEITLGVAYAPSQGALGNTDNTYVYISGDLPLGDSPVSLHATVGYEDGAFGDKKRDWIVGASMDLGSDFTATVDYVDTAHALVGNSDPTAVFSISKAF